MGLCGTFNANLFSHKSVKILDLGGRDEDAYLTRLLAVAVV